MATKAKKNQPAAAIEVAAAEPTTKQVVENTSEAITDEATEVATVEEIKKRERGYSQTAIDKADLERLNAFKTNIKETRKLNVSNQTIIAAALDCLATDENMAAFLKKLVAESNNKQRAKDLKQLEALQAKLAQVEPQAETETGTEANA
jgi:uncharacterized protein related to proFAR isomerase